MDRTSKLVISVFLVAAVGVPAIDLLRPHSRIYEMRAGDPGVRQRLFDMLQPVALTNCELERFGESQ